MGGIDGEAQNEAATYPDDGRRRVVERAISRWTSQLMDLTGRNQLLYYRTLTKGTLELTAARREYVELLLADRTVRLSHLFPPNPDDDPFDEARSRAITVHNRGLAHFEEKGIRTLYLAWGMAGWTTNTTQSTPAAPVLIRPINLDPTDAGQSDFNLSLEGDWELNDALLHLLGHDFNVQLPVDEIMDLLGNGDRNTAPDPTDIFDRIVKECRENVPNFEISDRVVVGTFAYTKLPMVRDLEGALDALAAHDLIAALAGDQQARDAIRAAWARELDPNLPDQMEPDDEFLILDTDSSQNRAINAAVDGEPLVIHGPPGTGKSQTIANLIATLSARGKRVLFVAEKRAAIEAVVKRLRQVGLHDLVLDLHGGPSSKRQLAQDLAHTLNVVGNTPQPNHSEVQDKLTTNRQALAEHERAMHEPREPWGLSMFDVYNGIIGVETVEATTLRFTPEQLKQLDIQTVRKVRSRLEEYARLAIPLRDGESSWAGAEITNVEQANAVLEVVAKMTYETLPRLRHDVERISEDAGLEVPLEIAGLSALLRLLDDIERLHGLFQPSIYEADLQTLQAGLRPASRGWWSRLSAQLFDRDYRTAKRAAREHAVSASTGGRALCQGVNSVIEQLEHWSRFGGRGDPYVPDARTGAAGACEELRQQMEQLRTWLPDHGLEQLDLERLADRAEAMRTDQVNLFRLPELHQLEGWLKASHAQVLVRAFWEGKVEAELIADAFQLGWLESLKTHLLASDPRLARFDGELQRKRARDYTDADEQHLRSTPVRVRRRVAEQALDARNQHAEQDQIVRKQAKLKRGHLPPRRLFEQAPDVLLALRPCWIMSPLVVSQILPAQQVFDVVIFDEASQILPADAVPSLLRGRQAIIAGDRHQLPPTQFFDAKDDGDDIEEEEELALTVGFESVLDVLSAVLPDRYMLQWHYRSQDERLIAFSNHHIYQGSLVTFPGVSGRECFDWQAVEHRPGETVDSRSNPYEVSQVVDLMIEHARMRPTETLGVIAMGIHHADRIEKALRDRLRHEVDPALDRFFDENHEERAFVKNLERVQGDERDAIILSTGYAKKADGSLPHRFGPITHEGGERRLNVAVSRARRRMTVTSSFGHTDIDLSRSRAEGVRLLRDYLKYAASGGDQLGDGLVEHPLNPFELSIKDRLGAEGLKVIPQYGASGYRIDFAICHPTIPGRTVLAVEADGASYHALPTVRDRDRLRQQQLERLGWRFVRIWSTDWFNDPDREVRRLLDAYHEALEQNDQAPTGVSVPVAETPEPANTRAEVGPAQRDGVRSRVPAGRKIHEYSHRELTKLATWIMSDTLLRTDDELLDELMAELGFKRRGKRIVAALTAAIRSAKRQRS